MDDKLKAHADLQPEPPTASSSGAVAEADPSPIPDELPPAYDATSATLPISAATGQPSSGKINSAAVLVLRQQPAWVKVLYGKPEPQWTERTAVHSVSEMIVLRPDTDVAEVNATIRQLIESHFRMTQPYDAMHKYVVVKMKTNHAGDIGKPMRVHLGNWEAVRMFLEQQQAQLEVWFGNVVDQELAQRARLQEINAKKEAERQKERDKARNKAVAKLEKEKSKEMDKEAGKDKGCVLQ